MPARARPDEGPDYTGVWVAERKIASIGVHVARGVTTHGFAVNVDNDLSPFGWVVACGLPDVQMTSLAAETGRDGALMPCFRKRVAWRVAQALGRRQRLISPGAARGHAAASAVDDGGGAVVDSRAVADGDGVTDGDGVAATIETSILASRSGSLVS